MRADYEQSLLNELSNDRTNKDKNNEQYTITDNLPHDNQNIVKSDADLLEDDRKSLARHNKQYSELLETYVSNTKRSLNFKYLKKHHVFKASMALFCIAPIIMSIIIQKIMSLLMAMLLSIIIFL